MIQKLFTWLSICLCLAACTAREGSHTELKPAPTKRENFNIENITTLNNTHWILVQIQSMDDALYIPEASTSYILNFLPQGQFSASIDCNRVGGSWTHTGRNQLVFGRLISTMALCEPQSLFDRVMNDLNYTRSFVMENGHLYLATMADGAILEFAPYKVPDDMPSPAFDCAKAEGSVENMICKDKELMNLDLYLDELFQAALTNFPEEEIDTLQAMQRGWISGRNDCWKSEGSRECVVSEYLMRISELEVKTGYLLVNEPAIFRCEDDSIMSVYFYTEAVLPLAVLNINQQQIFTWLSPAASGSRYKGRNTEFWQKGEQAMLNLNGVQQTCRL